MRRRVRVADAAHSGLGILVTCFRRKHRLTPVSPVSKRRVGFVISTTLYQDMDTEPKSKKQTKIEDPLNVNCYLEKRRAAETLYEQLFQDRVVDDYRPVIRKQLQELKKENIKAMAPGIVALVEKTYILKKDLAVTTQLAIEIADVLTDVNFEAIVCAVLNFQAGSGLVYERTLIAASAKIRDLLPPVRNFQRYGVKPSLVSDGVNAMSKALDLIAAGLAQRAAPVHEFIPRQPTRRRLRT